MLVRQSLVRAATVLLRVEIIVSEHTLEKRRARPEICHYILTYVHRRKPASSPTEEKSQPKRWAGIKETQTTKPQIKPVKQPLLFEKDNETDNPKPRQENK